jgi:hypothetical protein
VHAATVIMYVLKCTMYVSFSKAKFLKDGYMNANEFSIIKMGLKSVIENSMCITQKSVV